jgi:hypothetical protein
VYSSLCGVQKLAAVVAQRLAAGKAAAGLLANPSESTAAPFLRYRGLSRSSRALHKPHKAPPVRHWCMAWTNTVFESLFGPGIALIRTANERATRCQDI